MKLIDYLAAQERGASARMAESLGVSASYFSQLVSGDSAISPARCVQIETVTNGQVSRKDLMPDDWQSIWPELADDYCCKSKDKPTL